MKEKTRLRRVFGFSEGIFLFEIPILSFIFSENQEREGLNRMVLNQKTASISMDFSTTFEL